MDTLETLENLLKGKKWDLVYPQDRRIALENFELEKQFGKVIFAFFDGDTFSVWCLESFSLEGERILLNVSRNFGREKRTLTLISRRMHSSLEERVWKIAESFAEQSNTKLRRLEWVSDRTAQIFFESRNRKQILLVGFDERVEKLLSKAILAKRRWQIEQVGVAVCDQAEKLCILHSFLRNYWRNAISIYKISPTMQIERLAFSEALIEKTPKISLAKAESIGKSVRKIIEFDEERIDILPLKNEKLICFLGLPFASIKAGQVWFGIERNRRLTRENFAELYDLIETLRKYRHFDSPNKEHAFYRLMPERWLEAVLKKNIKLLDSELVLSLVYNQLNLDKEKVDLLAIRQDGRLVVVELKASESYEFLFQALNYWWKVESARRTGILQKAKIFSSLKIQEKPPMIYLVSPAMNFHKDLDFLASTINPDIEIFRFGLNQDWRREIKVIEKRKV